jgi:hypothetical protein
MARTVRFLRRTGRGLRSFLATVFGGFWLAYLYLFTIWLVVGSLAAFQIRDELRLTEGAPSFNDVKRSYEHYTARENDLFAEYSAAMTLYTALDDLDGQIAAKFAELQQAVTPGSAAPFADFHNSVEFVELTKNCHQSHISTDRDCRILNDYYNLIAEYNNTETQVNGIDYDKLWAEAVIKVDTLRSGERLAKHFDTYEFFALTNDDDNFFVSYMFLLNLPLQILVLLLTIVMGVLGSVITMTWSFIKPDEHFTFRRFVILPFVGGMSAFIIFVFIKAGQLTLTGGGGTEPLNPFVLSFVGIISGLLSERAYARMAQVGSNFFRTGEENPRYGIRLHEALGAAGVSQQELATDLQLSDEDTDNIINGKAAAGADQQQLIAACLRRNIRELFTDLPPKPAVVAPAPPAVVAQPG